MKILKEAVMQSNTINSIEREKVEAMTKPQISIRISSPLLTELNQYVKQTGTSKTDVVVSAIAQYLESAEASPMSQRVAELEVKVEELQGLIKNLNHLEV